MISRRLAEAMVKLTHALRELFGVTSNSGVDEDDFLKRIDNVHDEQEARVARILARQQRFEMRGSGEQNQGDGR